MFAFGLRLSELLRCFFISITDRQKGSTADDEGHCSLDDDPFHKYSSYARNRVIMWGNTRIRGAKFIDRSADNDRSEKGLFVCFHLAPRRRNNLIKCRAVRRQRKIKNYANEVQDILGGEGWWFLVCFCHGGCLNLSKLNARQGRQAGEGVAMELSLCFCT